ncbi:helix-turn-helix domain-containing protein [Galbibacter sp. BG1]|uniref:MarR family transcriptional regulator n=1 Tax=Galbibacter sp. BG1 TaxID=1170699 RepID=UPI0015C142F4|nr:MarR family transcriptional regulator [Galbibacter sp. BG1]QLE02901.1 helix-turn-helix domain-containing protein [Galbibacter sp. BG1]
MERDFKGIWIPKQIWLDKDLTIMEKLFLVEIDSLDNEKGCFAGNAYFSEFFGISKGRCTQILKELERKKYIEIDIEKEGKQITKRVVRILNTLFRKLNTPIKKTKYPYLENDDDNNTSINNTKRIERSALDFFKKNYPSQNEKFLMDFQNKINDFEKFTASFNAVFDKEKLEYNDRVIRGRLNLYALNWIERQGMKVYKNTPESNLPKPNYTKNAI